MVPSTRISIALCTYNGAQFLSQQLDSFAQQTHLPVELVVCDDGSSDETRRILSQFGAAAPFEVRIFENATRLGSTKNFERAISSCRGELIALSDQDDAWLPDKLATFHQFFLDFPDAMVAFSDADVIDDRNVLTRPRLWRRVHFSPRRPSPHLDRDIFSTLLKLDSVATGATMVLRSELRAQILPIPEIWVHDAWIAWIAALNGGMGVLPSPQICYRIHAGQQLGLDAVSVRDRLRHARQVAMGNYAEWIQRLEELQRHLKEKQSPQRSAICGRIEGKIQHLKGRMALGDSFPSRMFWALWSWRNYRRYSRGSVSMIKDMLFPSEGYSPR